MFLNKRYIIDSNSQCNIYIIDVKTGEKKEFVSEFAIPGQITKNDIIRFKNDVTIDFNEEYNQKVIQKLIEWSEKSPDYKSKKSEEQVQMEQKLTDESMNIFSNNIESIKSQITKKFPFSIISIFEKMSQEERNKTIKIRTQAEIKKMSEIAGLYEKIFRGGENCRCTRNTRRGALSVLLRFRGGA